MKLLKLLVTVLVVVLAFVSYKALEYNHYKDEFLQGQVFSNLAFYTVAGRYLKLSDFSTNSRSEIEKLQKYFPTNIYRGIYMVYIQNQDYESAKKVIKYVSVEELQDMKRVN